MLRTWIITAKAVYSVTGLLHQLTEEILVDCIFCDIVQKNIPAKLVYEDEQAIAFEDIHPKAPIHLLVVPKTHLTSLAHASAEQQQLLGHLLLVVQKLAQDKKIAGYKTVINTGREGGQVIDHLHLHLLAGQQLAEI